jgi:uncharacterized protein with FMN-binding domain
MGDMTSTSTSFGNSRIVNAGKVAAVIAAAGAVIAACGDDGSSDTATATTATSAAAAETTAVQQESASSPYKNGEYTAVGKYNTPGGEQELGVTVTLSNSVISALTLDTSKAQGPTKEFQGKFSSGINELVVGKSIDELDVSKVSGSSLTSGGFNAAIDEIKTEAAA